MAPRNDIEILRVPLRVGGSLNVERKPGRAIWLERKTERVLLTPQEARQAAYALLVAADQQDADERAQLYRHLERYKGLVRPR